VQALAPAQLPVRAGPARGQLQALASAQARAASVQAQVPGPGRVSGLESERMVLKAKTANNLGCLAESLQQLVGFSASAKAITTARSLL